MFFEGAIPYTVTDERAQRILTATHRMGFSSSEDPSAGELLGLLVGVKPAVLFPASMDTCADWARALNADGFDLIAEAHLIFDLSQLATRVEQEPVFAEWAGWNQRQTVEENVHRHMEGTSFNWLDGFLLGYPECAVRHLARVFSLEKRGISAIGTFDPGDRWSAKDRQTLQTLFDIAHQPRVSATDSDRLHQEVYGSDACRDLYRRRMPQASDEDYALLASSRTGLILGPWSTEVYAFAIHANDLNQTEHRALQERVNTGFTKHGFGPYLLQK